MVKDLKIVIAASLFTLAIPFSIRNVQRIWRNEIRAYDHVPAWWYWGGPLWRGFVRAILVGAGMAVMMTLIGWGIVLSDYGMISSGLVLLMLILFGALFACLVGIYLLNQPWVLVPPHLRHQPGALQEWGQGIARRLRQYGEKTGPR